jgi:hypothetical protein
MYYLSQYKPEERKDNQNKRCFCLQGSNSGSKEITKSNDEDPTNCRT